MNFLEYITDTDIKNFLSFKEEFKDQSHLVVVPSSSNPLVFVVRKENICFILEVISDEEIYLNGNSSIEFSFYWQAFLFRLFGDAYREYICTKIKNDLLTNSITITPFGIPEGTNMAQLTQDAITPILAILLPELNQKLMEVENEALEIWPNVVKKDLSLIRKKEEN